MIAIDCGLCILRPWRRGDLDALVKHADNRNVWLGVRDQFPHPYTREAGRSWIDVAGNEHPPTALAIEIAAEAVGSVGVVPGRDVNRHTGEIGYWLGEAHWNRGVATAALRHFLPWAAETFGLRRFFAETFATNVASARVLEKCGFVREGILRQHALKDGKYIDELVYGLLLNS